MMFLPKSSNLIWLKSSNLIWLLFNSYTKNAPMMREMGVKYYKNRDLLGGWKMDQNL